MAVAEPMAEYLTSNQPLIYLLLIPFVVTGTTVTARPQSTHPFRCGAVRRFEQPSPVTATAAAAAKEIRNNKRVVVPVCVRWIVC